RWLPALRCSSRGGWLDDGGQLPVLSVLVGAPFAAALLLLLVPERARLLVRLVALAGASVSLAAAIIAAVGYLLPYGGLQLREDYPLVPSLGIELRLAVDGWGISLVLLTGIIIVSGVLASWTLQNRAKEFFVFLLVLVAGVFGVFVSQDLFVFFLFY